jgi:hypothetical protein
MSRLQKIDQVLSEIDPLPQVGDVLRAFPDAHARNAQNKRAGRPINTAAPPRILERLNQGLWHSINFEAQQIADQTRWMWAKEAYDGTKHEFVGVGKPQYAPKPLLRSVAFKSFLPATKEDE